MIGEQPVARTGPRRGSLVAVAACLAAVLVMLVASAARAAVPGAFTTLATSPEALTAVTSDPTTGMIYAQGYDDQTFYQYDPATDQWSQLADAPILDHNDGGAAYLNGRIYVAYPQDDGLGVYDIATNTWSTIPNPLGTDTGDITAVNGLLYLAVGNTFVSYDPVSGTTTPLADPPAFTGTNECDGGGLEAWGALAPFAGKIYATQGNSCNGFAVYDIASNTWTQLPDAPDGVTLGGAIDPTSGTFFAYGDYENSSDGSDHFYAYDIATGQWSTPPNTFPFATLDDGGLTYVATPGFEGIYAVFGEEGTGFVLFSDLQDASVSEAAPPGTTAGSAAVLSLTVTNNGSAGTPISFTDTVPDGLSINDVVSGSEPCSVSGQQVTCTISGLRPLHSADVEIIVSPVAAGSYVNSASVAVAAGLVDPDQSNNSASATLQAAPAPVSTTPTQTTPTQTTPTQTTPTQTTPARKCVVPKLKGTPVGVARRVLSALGCKPGKVRKVHSRSVRKGDVIKTLPKPGTYKGKRAVALRLSSGPKKSHHNRTRHA